MAQRAADRIGEVADVLIDEDLGGGRYLGRAAHQAPEVDGSTEISVPGAGPDAGGAAPAVGDLVRVTVTGSEGVDLTAEAAGRPAAAARALTAGSH
jgi:tRNA A37 methylthiotransferase MiaB